MEGCAPSTGSLRPLVAPTPNEGVVVYVSGGVQVSRDGAWVDVEPGDTLGAGAILRTDADGSCELQFGDTVSVRVEPDTQLRCDRVAVDVRASVGGQLTAGAIIAKVKRLANSDLQISTPSAIAGVRGTEFMVRVSGGVTTVTVREGTVRVTRETTTVDVAAGRRADTAPGVELAEQPATEKDLAAIDAFIPSAVQTRDVRKLFKIVVTVEDPPDADIYIGSDIVGRGTWGIVLEEGDELTLVLKREGYEDGIVFVPKTRGRIVRKLKIRPAAPETPSEAAPETAVVTAEPVASEAAPEQPEAGAATAPGSTEPGAPPAPAEPSEIAEMPREPRPAAGVDLAFRADPAIGDDPFIRDMAEQFARRVPRFSIVTGPGSADLDRPAWPRGADLVGGMDNSSQFTYERLPQLVAAKLVRPLDGWFEWAQLAPVLVDAVRVGGRVYGVPIGGSSPVVYYNKDLVPRGAVRVERHHGPRGRVRPEGKGLAGRGRASCRSSWACSRSRAGSSCSSPTPRGPGWDRPEPRPSTTRCARPCQESGMSIGLPQEEAVNRFRNRDAAMLIDGPWSFGALRDALGRSLGVASLPHLGQSPGGAHPVRQRVRPVRVIRRER